MEHNRNSLRSIEMIKAAYLEILKSKDINKITIKEVTEKANLTRNTFYAHFRDVYDINDNIENNIIKKTIDFIDDAFKYNIFDNSLFFFKNVMYFIDNNRTMLNAILKHGDSANFINKYSDKILEHALNNMKNSKIKEKEGFSVFLKVLFTGSVFVIRQYLDNEITLTNEQIATYLNDIFTSCYELYL